MAPRTLSYLVTMLTVITLAGAAPGCGGSENGDGADASQGDTDADTQANDAAPRQDGSTTQSAQTYAELWYSVDDRLVYIELNPDDGSVVQFSDSELGDGMALGQNAITMLDDGSLVGARLSVDDDLTYFYHIVDPPRDGSPVSPMQLGVMPDSLMLEGLYTDCEGRLYGMDTGTDNTNSDGNRLLRFTGDYLAGDFSYVVVSDLASADVADIDDMGPGISNNQITDNPGLAIDTSDVYDFNYETGTGTEVGSGGTWGIHALGDSLFNDATARLYVLSSDGNLFEMDPVSYATSASLGQGPTDVTDNAGWSGLAGPLTDCDSGFTVE